MRFPTTIRARLMALSAIFAAGFVVFGVVAFRTMSTVEVNGPQYQRLADGKDLVADVLPPPAYIMESRLVMWELRDAVAQRQPKQVDEQVAKAEQLQKDFGASLARWSKDLPEGQMKDGLVRTAAGHAREFFKVLNEQYIPAAKAGQLATLDQLARGPLATTYTEHRTAIDQVLAEATAEGSEREKSVASYIRWHSVLLFAIGLAVLALVAGLAWAVARSILAPIQTTVAMLSDLAEGEGDLTKRLDESKQDELGQLSRSFNVFVSKLQDIMVHVQGTAQQVSQASRELTGASDTISSSAQEQASSLEETAASLEQITATVRQNADNAGLANQLASNAREVAEKGGHVVAQAVTAMDEINRSSKRIADIITTIDEIAFQTNLLALNAAVEAARAGEQGRGFAVVAAEVRNLAQRSASAAREIKGLIGDSVANVEDGAQLVNRSGATLDEIVTAVKRVTDVVAEIAAASREQSTGVEELNKAVTQMDHVTQSNAAQTEELSATAGHLSDQAREVLDLVGRFRLAA